MTLGYPNTSHNFDEARNRVRFWGHDHAAKIAFFIEEDALRTLDTQIKGLEGSFPLAFDAALVRIREAAVRAYMRDRDRSHVCDLTADDF